VSKRRTVYICEDCGRDYGSTEEADRCSRDDAQERERGRVRDIQKYIDDEWWWRVTTEATMLEIADWIADRLGVARFMRSGDR
jgi:DNA-directed RNA polymerase subunit RPC12/RpoP